jgi:predicted AAA+ superfamily ATPase
VDTKSTYHFIDIEKFLLYYFNVNEIIWGSKWSRDQVRALLLEQFEAFWQYDTGIVRTQLAKVEQAASLPHAVIVSGLRRAGKSTLLAQMAHKMGQDRFYYLNFEDDRFIDFNAGDFTDLYQALVEVYGLRKTFIIDEIQNIQGWEHFVRRFMDQGFKFFISGSNAALLSRELGTRLTGRYVPFELFPFSFREFLSFRGYPIPSLGRMTTVETAQLRKTLDDYLRLGGIPDALKYPEIPLLRTLYDDVLYRDIATRYRVEAVSALKELAFTIMSNPANLVSFNKLKNRFRLGSVNTIKNYISYLENSWLIFTINIYDYSVKRQQIAPKKIYGIDLGLINAVGFQFSPNTGKLLENLVFLALRQQTDEIFYYTSPESYEVDFYLPDRRQLIQVTQQMDNLKTRQREFRAIEAAARHINVEQALVLCEANEDPQMVHDIPVEVRSIAEWLLE